MEENKNLANGVEPLSNPELNDATGGDSEYYTTTYYCPHCGGVAEFNTHYTGFSYKCTSCGRRLKSTECERNYLTHTIKGDVHTVSGNF